MEDDHFTYEQLLETAKYLKERIPFTPKVGVICGSGMGRLAEALTDPIALPYEEIPNFPVSTVSGHVGRLVFGYLKSVPVVCMQGRFHYYEGYPLWKCAMPVRVMKLIGVTHLIATNAAGGLNPKFKVGDIMFVRDHINIMGFAGNNPLQGPNDERFGPRFPPMHQAYNKSYLGVARDIGNKLGMSDMIHEGVYTCLGGPNFETVAELKMLQMLGVDAVGMSTVHEVITARHCDLQVFALSLITNVCVTDYDTHEIPNHEEVMDVGKLRESILKQFVVEMVDYMGKEEILAKESPEENVNCDCTKFKKFKRCRDILALRENRFSEDEEDLDIFFIPEVTIETISEREAAEEELRALAQMEPRPSTWRSSPERTADLRRSSEPTEVIEPEPETALEGSTRRPPSGRSTASRRLSMKPILLLAQQTDDESETSSRKPLSIRSRPSSRRETLDETSGKRPSSQRQSRKEYLKPTDDDSVITAEPTHEDDKLISTKASSTVSRSRQENNAYDEIEPIEESLKKFTSRSSTGGRRTTGAFEEENTKSAIEEPTESPAKESSTSRRECEELEPTYEERKESSSSRRRSTSRPEEEATPSTNRTTSTQSRPSLKPTEEKPADEETATATTTEKEPTSDTYSKQSAETKQSSKSYSRKSSFKDETMLPPTSIWPEEPEEVRYLQDVKPPEALVLPEESSPPHTIPEEAESFAVEQEHRVSKPVSIDNRTDSTDEKVQYLQDVKPPDALILPEESSPPLSIHEEAEAFSVEEGHRVSKPVSIDNRTDSTDERQFTAAEETQPLTSQESYAREDLGKDDAQQEKSLVDKNTYSLRRPCPKKKRGTVDDVPKDKWIDSSKQDPCCRRDREYIIENTFVVATSAVTTTNKEPDSSRKEPCCLTTKESVEDEGIAIVIPTTAAAQEEKPSTIRSDSARRSAEEELADEVALIFAAAAAGTQTKKPSTASDRMAEDEHPPERDLSTTTTDIKEVRSSKTKRSESVRSKTSRKDSSGVEEEVEEQAGIERGSIKVAERSFADEDVLVTAVDVTGKENRQLIRKSEEHDVSLKDQAESIRPDTLKSRTSQGKERDSIKITETALEDEDVPIEKRQSIRRSAATTEVSLVDQDESIKPDAVKSQTSQKKETDSMKSAGGSYTDGDEPTITADNASTYPVSSRDQTEYLKYDSLEGRTSPGKERDSIVVAERPFEEEDLPASADVTDQVEFVKSSDTDKSRTSQGKERDSIKVAERSVAAEDEPATPDDVTDKEKRQSIRRSKGAEVSSVDQDASIIKPVSSESRTSQRKEKELKAGSERSSKDENAPTVTPDTSGKEKRHSSRTTEAFSSRDRPASIKSDTFKSRTTYGKERESKAGSERSSKDENAPTVTPVASGKEKRHLSRTSEAFSSRDRPASIKSDTFKSRTSYGKERDSIKVADRSSADKDVPATAADVRDKDKRQSIRSSVDQNSSIKSDSVKSRTPHKRDSSKVSEKAPKDAKFPATAVDVTEKEKRRPSTLEASKGRDSIKQAEIAPKCNLESKEVKRASTKLEDSSSKRKSSHPIEEIYMKPSVRAERRSSSKRERQEKPAEETARSRDASTKEIEPIKVAKQTQGEKLEYFDNDADAQEMKSSATKRSVSASRKVSSGKDTEPTTTRRSEEKRSRSSTKEKASDEPPSSERRLEKAKCTVCTTKKTDSITPGKQTQEDENDNEKSTATRKSEERRSRISTKEKLSAEQVENLEPDVAESSAFRRSEAASHRSVISKEKVAEELKYTDNDELKSTATKSETRRSTDSTVKERASSKTDETAGEELKSKLEPKEDVAPTEDDRRVSSTATRKSDVTRGRTPSMKEKETRSSVPDSFVEELVPTSSKSDSVRSKTIAVDGTTEKVIPAEKAASLPILATAQSEKSAPSRRSESVESKQPVVEERKSILIRRSAFDKPSLVQKSVLVTSITSYKKSDAEETNPPQVSAEEDIKAQKQRSDSAGTRSSKQEERRTQSTTCCKKSLDAEETNLPQVAVEEDTKASYQRSDSLGTRSSKQEERIAHSAAGYKKSLDAEESDLPQIAAEEDTKVPYQRSDSVGSRSSKQEEKKTHPLTSYKKSLDAKETTLPQGAAAKENTEVPYQRPDSVGTRFSKQEEKRALSTTSYKKSLEPEGKTRLQGSTVTAGEDAKVPYQRSDSVGTRSSKQEERKAHSVTSYKKSLTAEEEAPPQRSGSIGPRCFLQDETKPRITEPVLARLSSTKKRGTVEEPETVKRRSCYSSESTKSEKVEVDEKPIATMKSSFIRSSTCSRRERESFSVIDKTPSVEAGREKRFSCRSESFKFMETCAARRSSCRRESVKSMKEDVAIPTIKKMPVELAGPVLASVAEEVVKAAEEVAVTPVDTPAKCSKEAAPSQAAARAKEVVTKAGTADEKPSPRTVISVTTNPKSIETIIDDRSMAEESMTESETDVNIRIIFKSKKKTTKKAKVEQLPDCCKPTTRKNEENQDK